MSNETESVFAEWPGGGQARSESVVAEMKAVVEETVTLGRPADEGAMDHLTLELLEAGRGPVMTAGCGEICGAREKLKQLKKKKQGKGKSKKKGKKGKKKKGKREV